MEKAGEGWSRELEIPRVQITKGLGAIMGDFDPFIHSWTFGLPSPFGY